MSCAIPVFSVKVDALVIQKRPIDPIGEFVLKVIDQGFDVPIEIGGILGLEEHHVEETLAELIKGQYVKQELLRHAVVVRLTSRGEELLQSKLRESPKRHELRFGFDRLAWSLTDPAQGKLLRLKDVENLGLKEVHPRLKRRIDLAELSLDEIQLQSLRVSGVAGAPNSILAIDRILRQEKFFFEADIAIFDPVDGGRPQLSVLIDQRPSEVHESALELLGGIKFLEAEIEQSKTQTKDVLIENFGRAIGEEIAAETPTSEERQRRREARVEALRSDMDEFEAREIPALPPVQSPATIEFIDTFEHRPLLNESLRSASRRLVIISPWIAANVVNTGFLEQLSQLLRRGVKVHIGYGLQERPGDRPVNDRDKRAEDKLIALDRRYSNFILVKLGNTHSKQLLFDDTHVCGSFNWLSFMGDSRRTYRHEESTIVRRPDLVERKYEELCLRLEQALKETERE